MARPKKATVDYFPHSTTHGKTMFVLESRWGNDGYATWFKILEQLGNSDNHYIDCREKITITHLAAYCRIPESTLLEILDFLAAVNAIHSGFWRKKLIYSDNFIQGVTDAYRKRLNALPTLERVSGAANINLDEFPAGETPLNEQTDAGSTERERERERERESILSSSSLEISTEPKPRMMTINDFRFIHSDLFGLNMPAGCNQQAHELCQTFNRDTITEAFKTAAVQGKCTVAYVKGILEGNKKAREPNQMNQPRTFNQIMMENNRQAAREFAGDIEDDRPGQEAICHIDERTRGCIPL